MAATSPDKNQLRLQAIILYLKGNGYKTIGRTLGLSRDTVRNWITIYRLTGRKESVHVTGHIEPVPADYEFAKKRGKIPFRNVENLEEKYKEAREEYENSLLSLSDIAQKYGFVYHSFYTFMRRRHPESKVKHDHIKNMKALDDRIEREINKIYEKVELLKQQMEEEMNKAVKRLDEERRIA